MLPTTKSGVAARLAHLAGLHLPVHLIQARPEGLIQARSFDVFGDADRLECREVLSNTSAPIGRSDRTVPGLFAGVDDKAGDPVAFERRSDLIDLRVGCQPSNSATVPLLGPPFPSSAITRHPVPRGGGVRM